MNASLDLARIGVRREKIVPWDWPAVANPNDLPPKDKPGPGCDLVYVGHLSKAKGVPDAILAVKLLRDAGLPATLTIVGHGERDEFERLARDHGLADYVDFTGKIPHSQVLKLMREHDAVLVTSRHEYPEGLPNTINDSLLSRTPIVISDHPMFRGKITDGDTGIMYRASDPKSLAEGVRRLLADHALYAKISHNTEKAWRSVRVNATWGDVLSHWLDDDGEWLRARSLPTYS